MHIEAILLKLHNERTIVQDKHSPIWNLDVSRMSNKCAVCKIEVPHKDVFIESLGK